MNTKLISITGSAVTAPAITYYQQGIITAPVEVTFDTVSAAGFNPGAIKMLVDYGDGNKHRRDIELVIRPNTFLETLPPSTPYPNPATSPFIHNYLPGTSFITPITAQFTVIYGDLTEKIHRIIFSLRQPSIDTVVDDPHIIDTQLIPSVENKVFMILEAGNNGFGFNLVVSKGNPVDPI